MWHLGQTGLNINEVNIYRHGTVYKTGAEQGVRGQIAPRKAQCQNDASERLPQLSVYFGAGRSCYCLQLCFCVELDFVAGVAGISKRLESGGKKITRDAVQNPLWGNADAQVILKVHCDNRWLDSLLR